MNKSPHSPKPLLSEFDLTNDLVDDSPAEIYWITTFSFQEGAPFNIWVKRCRRWWYWYARWPFTIYSFEEGENER